MRVIVTGASGFVGRHLVEHLRNEGDDVHETDRAHDGVDITVPDSVRTVFEAAAPEVVYHLAGWSDVGRSWDHPFDAVHLNVAGTQAVLEAGVRSGARTVVVVSSAEVYGRAPHDGRAFVEDDPLLPVSPYAAGKAAAEMLCVQASLAHGLGVIRARAFNHLGPGQLTSFVAPAIAARIVEAERTGVNTIPVGNLEPRRDFTDVRDVVRAYRLLGVAGTPGKAYNVCSGHDISIAELVQMMLDHAEREIRLAPDPALMRAGDITVRRGDSSMLRADTGWAPTIPLEQTVNDVMNDLRDRAGSDVGAARPHQSVSGQEMSR